MLPGFYTGVKSHSAAPGSCVLSKCPCVEACIDTRVEDSIGLSVVHTFIQSLPSS